MSLLTTSTSDYDASSAYLAFRLWNGERPWTSHYALPLEVTGLSVEPPLGMGFGDRLRDFQGTSGSFKGRVQRAEKPAKLQAKRATKRLLCIT
jgi:hypothetical protein